MSFDPFWGVGGGSPPAVLIFSTMVRDEHLPICKAALDVTVRFEKLVAEAQMDLGRLRERSVRWQFVGRVQQ